MLMTHRLTSGCLRSLAFLFTLALLAVHPATADISGVLEVADTNGRLAANKEVVLLEATNGPPIERGVARTDDNGAFTIATDVTETDSVFYLSVNVRPRVRYICVVGGELPPTATINELTTVAACYAFAQFYRTGNIAGEDFPLYIANEMHGNLVDFETGEISGVLLDPPNADQTNSLRMLRTLANLYNRCAVNPYIAVALNRLTYVRGEDRTRFTDESLARLARHPERNVQRLYRLAQWRQPYEPALEDQPDVWCITVKVNDSGSDTFLIGGPANVAWDSFGYAWVTNNVNQGEGTSGRYILALQPNGKPSDGTNGTPDSPIFGGGLKGGGWGIDVDDDDRVWASNFGWGPNNDTDPPELQNWPQEDPADGTGSISLLDATDGSILSPDEGFYGGVWRAQAVEVEEPSGNVWIASLENDSVVVYLGGDPDNSKSLQFYDNAKPFGVLPIGDGEAWVTNSGGLAAGEFESSVAKVRFNEEGELETTFIKPVGNSLRVPVQDSYGNVWVASLGDSSVYAFDADGNQLGRFEGGGIDGPWGLAIDGEDNIWVSNFSDIEIVNDYGPGRISKLAGANPDTRPRRAKLGDPISPDTGYTVLSAGEEVTLHTGIPLYGEDAPPSFTPMMRQTSLQIDAAGNIWTINNWKPSDFNNLIIGNPGGDGIVIFVGLAPPPN